MIPYKARASHVRAMCEAVLSAFRACSQQMQRESRQEDRLLEQSYSTTQVLICQKQIDHDVFAHVLERMRLAVLSDSTRSSVALSAAWNWMSTPSCHTTSCWTCTELLCKRSGLACQDNSITESYNCGARSFPFRRLR